MKPLVTNLIKTQALPKPPKKKRELCEICGTKLVDMFEPEHQVAYTACPFLRDHIREQDPYSWMDRC